MNEYMNQSYEIVVSEPWDFEFEDGSNSFYSFIVKVIDSKNLLIRSDKEIHLKGISTKYVLLKVRHHGFSFDQFFGQEVDFVSCNGILLQINESKNQDLRKLGLEDLVKLINTDTPFFIGSIEGVEKSE